MARALIERYREILPVGPETPVVSLSEGGTPLLRADRIAEAVGLKPGSVFLKLEGMNPTGSFKDRGMTVAVSRALERGAKAVVCASTGNTSASAAAYAARARLRCCVLLPEGAVAGGKLAQVLAHGARLVRIKGNFDRALEMAREIAERHGMVLVNSLNPDRIEGQKTASYEIFEELGRMPDYHFLPVGNAGNITAYWKGYRELSEKESKAPPKMMGWQAEGAAPIVRGKPVKDPETVATAIRIGNPVSWGQAVEARDASGGAIGALSDEKILSAYRFLSEHEGVFAEPASAASVAGLLSFAEEGGFLESGKAAEGMLVVCTLTGHGLKDPDRPAAVNPEALVEPIEDRFEALEAALQ